MSVGGDRGDERRSQLERAVARPAEPWRPETADSRQRALLDAFHSVVESLDVDDVLRRIVEGAVGLVGARRGAIAAFDADGAVARIVHARDSERVAPGAPDPLGDALSAGGAVRVQRIEHDPRQIGLDVEDEGGTTFLAVPIRTRSDAYGALYLSGREGEPFAAEDEELLTALAAIAGIALENARLFEQSARRQRWSAALAEVTSALLSEDAADAIGVVLARVASVVECDMACVVLPVPPEDGADPELLIRYARGAGAEPFEGRRYPREDSLVGSALDTRRVVVADHSNAEVSTEADMGPSVVLPVVVSGEPVCALTLSRATGGAEFTVEEAELAADFAGQVGLAVELTQARANRQRVELADERSRIARDLHDHVIQRLFGAGLSLQALAADHPQAEDAILDLVDVIDGAISEIRMAVFALSDRRRDDAGSTRRRVLDVAQELTAALGGAPRIAFAGAVDLMVTDGLADDVVAVVRECLANAARHAGAREVSVEIAVDDRDVRVTVVDDGVGIPSARDRRSGTGNLAERARRRGGVFILGPGADGGTSAIWRAPHGADDARMKQRRRA